MGAPTTSGRATFRRNAQSTSLPPPAAEFEVHAGADDVLVERDRGVGAAAIGEAAGRVGKIDEQVFGLGGLGAKAYSRPTPEVQPTCVELMNGNAPAAASTLANAAPAVPYKRTWFQGAHPARPRTVASQLLCVVQPTNAHDPLNVVPLKLVQSQSPSTPNTHGPV